MAHKEKQEKKIKKNNLLSDQWPFMAVFVRRFSGFCKICINRDFGTI